MFAGVLAVATVLRAQETTPAAPDPATAPAPAPAPAQLPAVTPPGAAGSGDGATGEGRVGEPTTVEAQDEGAAAGERPVATNAPASADRTRPVGPTPGRFEPTEKVRADFDVAFPIDI